MELSYIVNNIKKLNDKINHYGFTKKYHENNNTINIYKFLNENNIKNAQDLYNFYKGVGVCEKCMKPTRFLSFQDGYKQYCNNCGRKYANKINVSYIKNYDTKFELRETIKKILKKINTYNSKKLNSNNFKPQTLENIQKNLYSDIINTTYYIPLSNKFNERIYHILNNLYEIPKCIECDKPLDNFVSNVDGYAYNRCKRGCQKKYASKNKNHHKILYNAYLVYKEKYDNLNLNSEYIWSSFDYDTFLKTRRKTEITFKHSCGHLYTRTIDYQGKLECPKCFPIRSKQQYYIYNYILNELNTKSMFNDRNVIAPKELDIIVSKYNFAIEYDGTNYHSFGKSSWKMFDNHLLEKEQKLNHLNKTEMCEDKGIQLFHIFDTEWVNPTKQYIWKSIIRAKTQKSKRIYARNCIIKEVSSSEAKLFLDNNHLQGNINSRVRIGLYFKDVLVQLITFRIPSQKKYKGKGNYELSRLCSSIDTSVIGGASKLLKYFERNYNPNTIISYANRRWAYSHQNVYTALNFTYAGKTIPNYFYFKGNFGKLESRTKFQKHKLNKILDNYNPELSETENMYNNGYRKIYDSGNLIYIKNYPQEQN